MTTKQAIRDLKNRLVELYDIREAAVIADWILEDLTGKSRINRLMIDEALTGQQEHILDHQTRDLLAGKPIQYILGYAWFMGQRFRVNQHVLIPRPETEELVQWVAEDNSSGELLMDVGTGSGCIPIMIKKILPQLQVHSTDISAGAIDVAVENALSHNMDVTFHCGNFLDAIFRGSLPTPSIIVSNPPYIPLKDKHSMHKNVTDHEPHIALFVPDDDALIFYSHILSFGIQSQTERIYFETHAELAEAVAMAGMNYGYTAEIRKDMQGKERMVRLTLNG